MSSFDLSGVGGNDSLNLGAVGGVGDKEFEVLLHLLFRKLVHTVELVPELLFEWFSALVVELNSVEAHSGENAHGGLEASIFLEVVELAVAGHDVNVEGRGAVQTDESVESISIGLGDTLAVDHLSELQSEGVLTVVLPHTSEVGLGRERRRLFVGEDQVLLLHELRGQLAKSVPFFLELLATFRSGGVNTKVDVGVLAGMGEGVESAVLLSLVVRVLEQVTAMSPPGFDSVKLGNFVIEETGAEAFTVLLKTEPLEHVGLLTLTNEGGWGPLRLHVLHGVLPGLSRVGIKLPAVSLGGGSPVRNLEALEDSTGLSVETHVTNTLKEGVGVEVLSVKMVHDVRLLVEFVAIEILNTHAYNNKLKSSRFWQTRRPRGDLAPVRDGRPQYCVYYAGIASATHFGDFEWRWSSLLACGLRCGTYRLREPSQHGTCRS